tara:strand:+ start:137 stop:391 length:255 start_codon:yes stop_codon:yes gene_type:complete
MVSLIDNLVIVVDMDFVDVDFVDVDFVDVDFVDVDFVENIVVFVDNIGRVEDRFVDVVWVVVVDISNYDLLLLGLVLNVENKEQ